MSSSDTNGPAGGRRRPGGGARLVEGRNAELAERLDTLDRLLERGLRGRPATFDGLKLPIPPPMTAEDTMGRTERQRVALFNDDIEQRLAGFRAADPEAVVWYAERVLNPSRYPLEVLNPVGTDFDPRSRDLTVDLIAPPRSVVPTVAGFRHDPDADTVVPVPRPAAESAARYRDLISQLALRAAHELLAARPTNIINAVVIAVWPDAATRESSASPLVATRFARESFGALIRLLSPGREPVADRPTWFTDRPTAPPLPLGFAPRSRQARLSQARPPSDPDTPRG